MKRLTAIVAANEDGVIGAGNALPWRVRSDMRFFRDNTINNAVIMGRKTHDSLGGCLPKRLNVVVTHGFRMFSEGPECLSAGSIIEALARAEAKRGRRQEVFVIGGASMYEQFAPYVDRYLITEIAKPVPNGDTWFDASIMGDMADWDRAIVSQGLANADGDEADYKIFEFKSRNARQIKDLRDSKISDFFVRSHRSSTGKFVLRGSHATA